MNDLKAIHVEGKMTLIFDENVTLHLEETKETTVETSDLSSGLFGQFLNMLFHEGNMSLEEQTKVMQMTVADFCAMYDTTSLAHQENDNPIPPGIPRMQFLQNIAVSRIFEDAVINPLANGRISLSFLLLQVT